MVWFVFQADKMAKITLLCWSCLLRMKVWKVREILTLIFLFLRYYLSVSRKGYMHIQWKLAEITVVPQTPLACPFHSVSRDIVKPRNRRRLIFNHRWFKTLPVMKARTLSSIHHIFLLSALYLLSANSHLGLWNFSDSNQEHFGLCEVCWVSVYSYQMMTDIPVKLLFLGSGLNVFLWKYYLHCF